MTVISKISPQTLKTWMDEGKAILLDVREQSEYDESHIPGSVFIPLSTFDPSEVPQVPGKAIVIHCRSGKRAETACHYTLEEFPTLEIYSLEGGILAWENAGFPVDRGKN